MDKEDKEPHHGWTKTYTKGGRKIMLREAGLADYDAVMRISDNIYAGVDYLPYEYFVYAQSYKTRMYVAEVDGQVVHYRWSVFDHNEDYPLQGATRTKVGYDGLGLMWCLRKETLHPNGPLHTEFPNFRSAVMANVIKKNIKSQEDQGVRQPLYKFHFRVYQFSKPQLSKCLKNITDFEISNRRIGITTDKARTVELLLINAKHLFPSGFFMTGAAWIPRAVDEYNINLTASICDVILASNHQDPNKVEAVVFLSACKVLKGASFNANVYTNSRDKDLLKELLYISMQKILSVMPPEEGGYLFFNVPDHCLEELQSVTEFVINNRLGKLYESPAFVPYTAGIYKREEFEISKSKI